MGILWILGLAFVVWYAFTRKSERFSPLVRSLFGLVAYILGGIVAFVGLLAAWTLLGHVVDIKALVTIPPLLLGIIILVTEIAFATTIIRKIVVPKRVEVSEEGLGTGIPLPRKQTERNRLIRLILRTLSITLLAFFLLTDPTSVGHYKPTNFLVFFRNLGVSYDASSRIAYFVNEFTLLALAIWLVASQFRNPEQVGQPDSKAKEQDG